MEGPYGGFKQINGHHPGNSRAERLRGYEARILRGSKVVYFNFALAKDMGLVGEGSSRKAQPGSGEDAVETFALRIINEYDQLTCLKVPRVI